MRLTTTSGYVDLRPRGGLLVPFAGTDAAAIEALSLGYEDAVGQLKAVGIEVVKVSSDYVEDRAFRIHDEEPELEKHADLTAIRTAAKKELAKMPNVARLLGL